MELNRDLKKRLDALNRRRLSEAKGVRSPILYPRQPSSVSSRTHAPSCAPLALTEAVGGQEIQSPAGGRALLISKWVREIDEVKTPVCDRFRAAFGENRGLRRCAPGLFELGPSQAEDVIFVDLETTGLGSTPLFLIGTMVWEGEDLLVRQYFARDYAEEAAVISLFLDVVAGKRLLVSFNGKSFDLPYVEVRAVANGIAYRVEAEHLDLLHVSRRIWKGKLPDCRLQTLEQYVCGRLRCDDIPGEQIPKAYHDFVRTGDGWQMVECLRHNQLDLVTLAEILVGLPGIRDRARGERDPWTSKAS